MLLVGAYDEAPYATKSVYLDYRPEYDDRRFLTKITNDLDYDTSALAELARFDYTIDNAGNRLSNDANRGTSDGFSKMQDVDEYAYDDLHRLTGIDYGSGVTSGEEYDYDILGNRDTYYDHRNTQTTAYTSNLVNEYLTIGGLDVEYDDAGNMTKRIVATSPDRWYAYSYDYENRLTAVDFTDGTTPVSLATFDYDALGRLIRSFNRFDSSIDDDSQSLRYFHDGQNIIAEYESGSSTLVRRYVHGTTYVDERAVLIEGAASSAETYYYLLQELYTVAGLVKKNGTLAEVGIYDGYGEVDLWDYSDGDFDRDGDVDATDQTTFTANLGLSLTETTHPMTDLDMDGDTDAADSGTFTTIKNSGGAVAQVYVSGAGNPYQFTGRRLFMLEHLPEIGSTPEANRQLQYNRARFYEPSDGRWLQRDPIGYADGMNLCEYVLSRATHLVDPLGRHGWSGDNLPPVILVGSFTVCFTQITAPTLAGQPGYSASGQGPGVASRCQATHPAWRRGKGTKRRTAATWQPIYTRVLCDLHDGGQRTFQ